MFPITKVPAGIMAIVRLLTSDPAVVTGSGAAAGVGGGGVGSGSIGGADLTLPAKRLV